MSLSPALPTPDASELTVSEDPIGLAGEGVWEADRYTVRVQHMGLGYGTDLGYSGYAH